MSEASCGRCGSDYDGNVASKTPRILTTCGHTFCEECVRNTFNAGEIICPLDEQKTKVRNVGYLKKNFAILEINDELKHKTASKSDEAADDDHEEEPVRTRSSNRKVKIPCDENNSHTATFYCTKCELNFCKKCSAVTHSAKIFANHEIVKIDAKPEPKTYCAVHKDTEIEFYCKEETCSADSRIFCGKCLTDKDGHLNHEHDRFEDAYNSKMKALNEGLKLCKEKIKKCDENRRKLELASSTFDLENSRDIERLTKMVRGYFKKQSQYVNDYEHQLKDELKKFSAMRISEIEARADDYDGKLNEIESIRSELLKLAKMDKNQLIFESAKIEQLQQRKENFTVKAPGDLIPCKMYKPKLEAVGYSFVSFGFMKHLAIIGSDQSAVEAGFAFFREQKDRAFSETDQEAYVQHRVVTELWDEDKLLEKQNNVLKRMTVFYHIDSSKIGGLDREIAKIHQIRAWKNVKKAKFIVCVHHYKGKMNIPDGVKAKLEDIGNKTDELFEVKYIDNTKGKNIVEELYDN